MKLWLTLLSLVFAGNTFGSIIGYNFVSNWGSPTIQGETALGFSEWTDSVDEVNAPGGTEVPNSTDPFAITTPINAPMVNVSWSSANMWAAGDETNPDQGLFRVYLDDGGNGITISVSGLSAWLADSGDSAYGVRFYRSTDNGGAGFSSILLFDGATTDGAVLETIPTVLPGDPSIGDGSYPTGTGGGGSRLIQGTAGSFTSDTITFWSGREPDLNGAPVRGTIAGFQIYSIPEPSTGLLALLGIAMFAWMKRRRA